MEDFSTAAHTFVISDLHLADAEAPHPRNPLWKKFKRPEYFIDDAFAKFLEYVVANSAGPAELILNGDIFDFDSILAPPKDASGAPLFKHLSWLEKLRGLKPEQDKSRFKMETIIHDHPVWFDALGKFLRDGNRAIFIIGNHDIELHWPAVQSAISERLKAAGGDPGAVRFAEWFYISNKDTFIEHGNQYDPYSLCDNPLNPAIHERHGDLLKLPFGNLAGKFMLNGMGLMNPHVEGSYIKDSLFEYLHFTYKYVVKTQPLIVWDWFWSATATWVVTLREGFARPLSDPLTFADRVGKVAERANASPQLVLALRELHAHPAYFSPLQLLRELWLDRVIAVVLVVALSFTFFSYLNVFIDVSYWWFLVPLALLIPIPLLYARTVTSEVEKAQAAAMATAPTAVKLANLYAPVRISRVVYGHTHREMKKMLDTETGADTPVEYLNTGTWSPAFHDVECTQRYGRSCFAWIKPGAPGGRRVASLYEWKNGAALEIVAN